MNYKKIPLFLTIITLITCSLFPACKGLNKDKNAHHREIYTRYKSLMDATSYVDISKILDYTHPKLFNIVPKTKMEQSLKDVFSKMKMITTDLAIQNYSPIFEFKEEKYVLLEYTAKMKIINMDENMDISTFAEIMAVSYGKEHVESVDENSILIHVKGKSTFAITDKADQKWYFIENNPESPIFNKLIPKEVQEKFALHNQ